MPHPNKSNKNAEQNPKQSYAGKDIEDAVAPSNNLWVGNLANDVSDSDLMGVFGKYGALDSITSYSSRSYAFVYFKHIEDARDAKNSLQGTFIRGSPIKIEFARPVCSALCVLLGLHSCCYLISVVLSFITFDLMIIFWLMFLKRLQGCLLVLQLGFYLFEYMLHEKYSALGFYLIQSVPCHPSKSH